jgi:hypothetical protein
MVSLKILKFQGKVIDGLLGRVYHYGKYTQKTSGGING